MKRKFKLTTLLLTLLMVFTLMSCDTGFKDEGQTMPMADLKITLIHSGNSHFAALTNVSKAKGSVDGYQVAFTTTTKEGTTEEHSIDLSGTINSGKSIFVAEDGFQNTAIYKMPSFSTSNGNTGKIDDPDLYFNGYTTLELKYYGEVVDMYKDGKNNYVPRYRTSVRTYAEDVTEDTPWNTIKSAIIEKGLDKWWAKDDYAYTSNEPIYVFAGNTLIKNENATLYLSHDLDLTYSWISRKTVNASADLYTVKVEDPITINGTAYKLDVKRTPVKYATYPSDTTALQLDGKDGFYKWTAKRNEPNFNTAGTFDATNDKDFAVKGVVSVIEQGSVPTIWINSPNDSMVFYGKYVDNDNNKLYLKLGDVVTVTDIDAWKIHSNKFEFYCLKDSHDNYTNFKVADITNSNTVYYKELNADDYKQTDENGNVKYVIDHPEIVHACGKIEELKQTTKLTTDDGNTVQVRFNKSYFPDLLPFKVGDKVDVYGIPSEHEGIIQIYIYDPYTAVKAASATI